MEFIADLICLFFELLFHCIYGFTQLLVTAMWQIEDPALKRKRNSCLTVYGIAAAVFLTGLAGLWLKLAGFIFFFLCLGITLILLIVAGHLADNIEKQVLQQETPAQQTEGEIAS